MVPKNDFKSPRRRFDVIKISMDHPKFEHPFTMIVAGSTGSGKTHLVRNILSHHRLLMKGTPKDGPLRVLWCYGINQDLHKEPISSCTVMYSKELNEKEIKRVDPGLIVVDDLMLEKQNDPFLSNLFTRGSHHMGISIIFIVQNVFSRAPLMRTISLNSKYIILTKSPRDRSQSYILGRQLFPDKPRYFIDAYTDATQPAYGYLVVDLSQTCPDDKRLRTDIFNIHPKLGHIPSYYTPTS